VRRLRARRVLAGAVALLALSLGARRIWRGGPEAPLGYTVAGAAAGPDGYITRVQTASATLQFSDGTRVDLAQKTRARVLSTSRDGAVVRLDDGRAHFSVIHRPRARWSVEAGPFVVQVTGTTFDVSWSPAHDTLRVRLLTGVVSVHGPLTRGGVTLLPGQELVANPDGGTFKIEPTRTTAAPAPAVEVPPPAPDPTPPAAPEPTVRPEPAVAPRTATARPHTYTKRAPELGADWARRIAAGDFESIVRDAERCGRDGCVRSLPSDFLSVLGDAARYTGRRQLARDSLIAQRARFPGTAAAHEAAFLLGRLAEEGHAPLEEAVRWYDVYLEEAPRGAYAAEALGRKLLRVADSPREHDAREVAREYLERHPRGPHAARARGLLEASE
jgi:hypothetical protein